MTWTVAHVLVDGIWEKRACADCRHRYLDTRFQVIEVCVKQEPVMTTENARRGRCGASGKHWEAK